MAERERIAVVGCGVAGLTAAYLLQHRYDVEVFEANDYIGGHTHTIPIPDGPDAGTPVDTGFIVCNDRTYPLFHRLLGRLGVAVRRSDMSFSFHDEGSGFHYCGSDLNGLFAQRSNALRPSFWRLLRGIRRFWRDGMAAVDDDGLRGVTIGEFIRRGGYGREFADWFLLPMMAAIWSAPPAEAADFPAQALLRFFRNHGLLSYRNRPTWQTVVGGSHAYVQAFRRQFRGTVHVSSPVLAVQRHADHVAVSTDRGTAAFDQVVMATHADQALAVLADASPEERRLLGPWRYQDNHVVLHTDPSVLPPSRRAWASWNYAREAGSEATRPVSVAYYMNRLQGLCTTHQYSVSLNRRGPIAPEAVVCELRYAHPVYTFSSMATQASLPSLNGVNRTFFCGSYFSYGFHEDAVRSAVAVGQALGVDL